MILLLAGVLIAGSTLLATPAQAAFPGANGKIAFNQGPCCATAGDAYKINPDGTGLGLIIAAANDPVWSPSGAKIAYWSGDVHIWTTNADGSSPTQLANGLEPAWSPDGTKIIFWRSNGGVWAMNQDGSGQANVNPNGESPDWSPDGSKIAVVVQSDCESGICADIYLMNADGSNLSNVTNTPAVNEYDPAWSPDGNKIAFTAYNGIGPTSIWVMNPDGTGRVNLGAGVHPAWSPDATKIAFHTLIPSGGNDVYVMNADGTGRTFLHAGRAPDWQRIPTSSYEHPATASSLSVSLVPAFRQCGTGGNPSNAKHSPPLATNSCNPPRPGSVLAAVGVTSQSSAQMTVVAGNSDPTDGNQANVSITAGLTDIQSTAGGDYNPNPSGADLTAVTRLRFTDKANGYGGLPATATEYDFKVPIDCSSTPDPFVGSSCSATATANALVPGLIQEQRQTVVQTFRVRVDDSGANGVRGDADDRIFATQGLFVP